MPTIHNLEQYRKFTKAKADNRTALGSYQQGIITELNKKDSMLAGVLANLSEEKKTSLIRALIICDNDTLNKELTLIFSQANLKPDRNNLADMTESVSEEIPEDDWLNPTTALLIDKMIHFKKNSLNYITRILQNAMQEIPETMIHIKGKVGICREIDRVGAKEILDYSYNESLTPLESNRFSGTINIREFITIMKLKSLDHSEFIMLSLGVLQKEQDKIPAITSKLNKIRQLYLKRDYEEAFQGIKSLNEEYQAVLNPEFSRIVGQTQWTDLVEVIIEKNYSRRFFENRLSQLYTGSILKKDIVNIDRMSRRMVGKAISNAKEAEDTILNIADLSVEGDEERVMQLKRKSTHYMTKDRYDKHGFTDKSQESANLVADQEVLSRNKGLLTSNAPNFYDELSNQSMRNRIVDIASVTGDDEGYSFSHPRSAFAGSFSGHCFKIVATLERYMKANREDEFLNEDINVFLKGVVASYISKGYHGFFEMVDVLQEPHIQQIFTDCNVKLNLDWLDNLLEQASKDTQEYTKTLCLKKVTHASLLSSSFFSKTAVADKTEPESRKTEQLGEQTDKSKPS